MIRKFLHKFKNKSTKKSSVETDSVPESSRHIAVSSPIPCESSTSVLVIPSNDSFSASPSLNQDVISAQPMLNDNRVSPNLIPHSIPTVQLSVSNSHGFHIGDVHNVTVSNGSTANFNGNDSGLAVLGKPLRSFKPPSQSEPEGTDSLEYIYDKIKEWEISLISENVEEGCWKSIGIALNMEEDEVNNCFAANHNKQQQAVFNILIEYIKKFPDTSLGYIVSILRETKQVKAIDKIAKLRL